MAADTTHQCPARGCTRRVPRSKLMCYPHWKLVPSAIQCDVYNSYRRVPGASEHLQAMEDAIAAVNARLEDRDGH